MSEIAYYRMLDAHEKRERGIELVEDDIHNALLSTGHPKVCDDQFLQNLDPDTLRAAMRLHDAGGYDAALVMFVRAMEAAASTTAHEWAATVYDMPEDE